MKSSCARVTRLVSEPPGSGLLLTPDGLGARRRGSLCLLGFGQTTPPAVPGALGSTGRLPAPHRRHFQSRRIQVFKIQSCIMMYDASCEVTV